MRSRATWEKPKLHTQSSFCIQAAMGVLWVSFFILSMQRLHFEILCAAKNATWGTQCDMAAGIIGTVTVIHFNFRSGERHITICIKLVKSSAQSELSDHFTVCGGDSRGGYAQLYGLFFSFSLTNWIL